MRNSSELFFCQICLSAKNRRFGKPSKLGDYLLFSSIAQICSYLHTVFFPANQAESVQRGCLLRQGVMKEVVERIDFCSERFQATHGRLSYALSLIDPDKEYRAFLDTHKSAPPAWMDFDLVSPLLGNQLGKYEGTLRPDRLAVDDLTIHDLRNRFVELPLYSVIGQFGWSNHEM